MEYKRLLNILQDYVENDYKASGDPGYILATLEEVASKEEITEIGFGWLYPEDC